MTAPTALLPACPSHHAVSDDGLVSETPGDTDEQDAQPVVRNDFAAAGLVLAILALICDLFAVRVGIGFGAAATVLALVGLRRAVRTDIGLARTLTALLLGFLALVLGAIVLGGQRGGQYAGLPTSSVGSGTLGVAQVIAHWPNNLGSLDLTPKTDTFVTSIR